MNAIATTDTPAAATGGLERVAFVLLLGFAGALQLSIAVAQTLLILTALGWIALLIRDGRRPEAPAFFLPLATYGAATLVSTAFSLDPRVSLVDSRQLLLFAVVPIVYDLASRHRATTVVDVLIAVGAASAAFGIVQYGLLHYDSLGRRPDGALSHYMTYSGTLMLTICAAAARLVFGVRERTWPALVMPALVVALALTLTRGTWVGACVAAGLLFVLRDFRLVALLPVLLAVMLAFAPDTVTSRMFSIFDLRDPSNRDRLSMVRTGSAMIADHPLTGVGPDMIPQVYERYRDAAAVNQLNVHLHNVPLQIAAERGLPALAAWLWFVVACAMRLFSLIRERQQVVLAATGLAALAGMFAAGFFEYNFGDSEFLMMLLVLITLPFAAARAASGR